MTSPAPLRRDSSGAGGVSEGIHASHARRRGPVVLVSTLVDERGSRLRLILTSVLVLTACGDAADSRQSDGNDASADGGETSDSGSATPNGMDAGGADSGASDAGRANDAEPDARTDGGAGDAGSDGAAMDDAGSDAAATVDCDAPIDCATPDAMKTTLCGSVIDVGSGQPIRATTPTGTACDTGSPASSGPCALRITFYDAVEFAGNPGGAAPLVAAETRIDDCGRFRGVDVTPPTLGLIAVVVDDAGVMDLRVPTMTAFVTAAGTRLDATTIASASHVSDEAWTSSAGLSVMTFVERGAYLPVFLHGTTPVSGVTITRNGSSAPTDDYYFADTDTGGSRTTVDAGKASTGPNGAGLILSSSLVDHSGSGAAPSGCEWPSELAMSIPGVLWYRALRAQVIGDPSMPCP